MKNLKTTLKNHIKKTDSTNCMEFIDLWNSQTVDETLMCKINQIITLRGETVFIEKEQIELARTLKYVIDELVEEAEIMLMKLNIVDVE